MVFLEEMNADVLERVSDLIKANAFYGTTSLIKSDSCAKALISASQFIFGQMDRQQHSNIVCSMLAALEGKFGFNTVNSKTEINPIWLSALTCMYWFFDLDKTARMKIFYNDALCTNTVLEISNLIECCRNNSPKCRPIIPI